MPAASSGLLGIWGTSVEIIGRLEVRPTGACCIWGTELVRKLEPSPTAFLRMLVWLLRLLTWKKVLGLSVESPLRASLGVAILRLT